MGLILIVVISKNIIIYYQFNLQKKLQEEFLRALGRQNSNENGTTGGGAGIDGDEIDVNCRVAMIHFYNGPNVFANFSEVRKKLEKNKF
jgi:hypothetical protein